MANTYRLNFIKIGGILIFGGGGGLQKLPIRGVRLHVTCDAHFWTLLSYSSQKSCVKIRFGLVEPFKSYLIFIFFFFWGGGVRPAQLGGLMWPAMPIFEPGRAILVKSHVWKFGLDWLSLSRVIVSTNIFRGAYPQMGGGLHLTCDAHFRTQMSYSSKTLGDNIWFGLVEIGSMPMLREAEDPLLGGVTCDLQCPFLNLAELF